MPPPLRILLITGEYPPMEGGVADYTCMLAQEMARQGTVVAVLTSTKAGTERQNGAVRCYPRLNGWNLPSLLKQVKLAVRTFQPHFIHIQYQTAAFSMNPAINLLPALMPSERYCVTYHDLREPYLFPKAGGVRRWVTNLLARHCRAVFVTNSEDECQLAADKHIHGLHLVPIGSNIEPTTDTGLTAALHRRWRLNELHPVLGYFGMINSSKGIYELVQALAKVRDSGLGAALLIIGGGTGASDPTNASYLASVRREIAHLALEPYITWTGHLSPEETSAALRCADMVVLPYQDGASFRRGSLMAALAHGLPIISTQSANIDPQLVPGGNILLVPPKDATALAQTIITLANDGELARHLAAGAAQLAAQFNWQAIARQTLEVLYAAVAG